ncbi:hypothetical protein DFQ28_010910 [Apophysomyces sp. BC1034]|nr:hypothetical protein DFQ29_005245 [Apophysomyces sp. BC1021]KAG0191796.1 hypothetical protein DFQ28_010910 [Apophysomyces sp. BC1034]
MALLAQKLQGVVIVMEHRCYGKSQPGEDLSVKNLKTLSTAHALEDMANIIRKVKLPIDLPPAPQTKWIVYGGSYSGNLAAWMREKYPDIVFAAVPSSAPVQMSYNYYDYFTPIQQYGPRHCIQAVERVVRYIDHILFSPFLGPKKALKKRFGVEDLAHDDDFAELLTYPLGMWQAMSPTENPFVEKFCSGFDNAHTLEESIDAYAKYIKKAVERACADAPSINECLDSHDPRSPQYTDVKSEGRAWMWQVCTEYAYWQTAAPLWRPSIVSRRLNTRWYQRQCPLMFGEHEVPVRPLYREINREYEGWHLRLTRTFWIDGEWDPWRTLSVQSDVAPNRDGWNDDAYFVVLPESVHHWDFFVSDNVSEIIKETQQKLYEAMSRWLLEADHEPNTTAVKYQQPLMLQ